MRSRSSVVALFASARPFTTERELPISRQVPSDIIRLMSSPSVIADTGSPLAL